MTGPGIGIGIWGVVTGAALVSGDAITKTGLTVPLAILFTLVPFAGSAQLGVLPLLAVHAPLPVIWITAGLINLRFVIFSAASRKHFVNLPFLQKVFTTYLNGDVGSAIFLRHYADFDQFGTSDQLGYFFGLATVNWFVWIGSSIFGIFLGDVAPRSWGLEMGATFALLAVVIPMVTITPTLVGVMVTAVVSVVANGLPLRLGLLLAVVIGVASAFVADRIFPRAAATVAGGSIGGGSTEGTTIEGNV
jgi:predicted branched-subunit amino acid permease